MASAAPPVVAERGDIHKSCKSLETLLGVVHDYCEAAGAVVMLQKKLAKALRETAGLKVTADIPTNAMNTTAIIFEVLSEINAKFTKVIDKEYDVIGAEVQKWFKKLAKEERIHDEKMEKTNIRIKQAGQLYEKKAKKNPREAVDEHTRYINLLSTLGPEVAQEKQNHALQVTQRHTTTTYSVAAFVSRIADAEWLRTCEAVRRFASPIGQLGEWRALCEGGWTGSIPQDLLVQDRLQHDSIGEKQIPQSRPQEEIRPAPASVPRREVEPPSPGALDQNRSDGRSTTGNSGNSQREWEYALSTERTTTTPQHIRPGQSDTTTSSEQTTSASNTSIEQRHNPALDTDSRSTLESFPVPPTHLPLPPSQPLPRQQTSRASSVSPQLSRLSESPIEEDMELDKYPTDREYLRNKLPEESYTLDPGDTKPQNIGYSASKTELGVPNSASSNHKTDPFSDRREYDARVDRHESHVQVQPRNVDTRERSHDVERTDTIGSSVSVVAVMRRRYSQQSGTTSPQPKDIPRLPLSVTEMASRYQPLDGPLSPQQRTMSPPSNRQLPIPPSDHQHRSGEFPYQGYPERGPPPGTYSAIPRPVARHPTHSANSDHRQRIDEQVDKDIREKEMQLRAKEREIETRVRELDMERARLINERLDVYGSDNSSQRGNSKVFPTSHPLQQHRSHVEFPAASPHPRQQFHGNDSSTQLAPPPDSQSQTRSQASSGPRSRHHSLSQGQPHPQLHESPTSPGPPPENAHEHAAFCGCDRCSISKYKTNNGSAPSPQDLRSPDPPITLRPQPDKPKSWMRRLSMPVVMGNAFSLDSKKSSGALRNLNVLEDGKIDRRSYESGGVSNRSSTNLGRR